MIWFLGDVHGRFDHVIRLVKLHRLKAGVFLGDLECSLPLDMILRPILEQAEIWFIHGNHDSDRPAYWHNLHGFGLAELRLHGRVGLAGLVSVNIFGSIPVGQNPAALTAQCSLRLGIRVLQ